MSLLSAVSIVCQQHMPWYTLFCLSKGFEYMWTVEESGLVPGNAAVSVQPGNRAEIGLRIGVSYSADDSVDVANCS